MAEVLAGRRALVTGASRGIGRAIAVAFAEAGAEVVALARNGELLASIIAIPRDAKALKAAVSTYPKSGYDLTELLTALGTGEAVITVLSERGAPTPVAWTRMRAPQLSPALRSASSRR